MPLFVVGANAEKATCWSIPIRCAGGCCRLWNSSGSRHCRLRVLQLGIGDHAASSHPPCAGRGRWRSEVPSAISRRPPARREPRPKAIAHNDAIAAARAFSRHSARGREGDVLMASASHSAIWAPACLLSSRSCASPFPDDVDVNARRFKTQSVELKECVVNWKVDVNTYL